MTQPLSRYLKDFSAPKAPLRIPPPPKYFPDLDDGYTPRDGFGAMPSIPAIPEIDIQAERREAFEEGRRDAISELSFEHQQQLTELRADHAAEMHALITRCDNELAAMIFDRFCDMASQLAGRIADETARVLAPVMTDVLMDRALTEMAQTIATMVMAGEAGRIIVRGPLPLFETLTRRVGDETAVFRHIETDDIDLAIEIGDSLLTTRMAQWAETVRKVL